jgi:hypothetical protein
MRESGGRLSLAGCMRGREQPKKAQCNHSLYFLKDVSMEPGYSRDGLSPWKRLGRRQSEARLHCEVP